MWQEEFAELLLTFNDYMDVCKLAAYKTKYKKMPKSIYKYRSFDNEGKALDNLIHNRIWLADPNTFNDPYDSMLSFAGALDYFGWTSYIEQMQSIPGTSPDDIRDLEIIKASDQPLINFGKFFARRANLSPSDIDKEAQAFVDSLERMYEDAVLSFSKQYKEAIRVSCFSAVNDSILMWGHYASNHTGFCIEYDFKQTGMGFVLTEEFYPVVYKNTPFYIPYGPFEKDNKNLNHFWIVYAATRKGLHWRYEKEWRLIVPKDTAAYVQDIPTPKAIYLGAMISESDEKTITEIAKSKSITVYKMRLMPFEFRLIPELSCAKNSR